MFQVILKAITFLLLITLTFATENLPTKEDVEAASADILKLITDNSKNSQQTDLPFIGGFVRLAFHDCVGDGGCDGCVDHTKPDNAGLKRYTDALDIKYNATYSNKMSRADFYAFSSIVALEQSTSDATGDENKFNGRSNFRFGRTECQSSPAENVQNELPSSFLNIDDVLEYFHDQFGFTSDEVVALLGAHSLGRTHEENSGFEGRWVRSPNRGNQLLVASSFLDNTYYKTFIDRPKWHQHSKTVGGVTRKQWQGLTEETNTVLTRNEKTQPNILLNTDFCLLWNFTVSDTEGTIDCDICIRDNPPARCCDRSSTEGKATVYARDNAAFIADFTEVFQKMVHFNSNSDLKLISELESESSKDVISMLDNFVEEVVDGIMEDLA